MYGMFLTFSPNSVINIEKKSGPSVSSAQKLGFLNCAYSFFQ